MSVKAAAELYGVVVDAETFAVDQAATDKLRAAKATGGPPMADIVSTNPPTMARARAAITATR